MNCGPFSIWIERSPENLDVNGHGGNDVMIASSGLAGLISLDLDGGEGNDLLIGGDGADVLRGGAGNDTLLSNRGNDILLAGDGNDFMNGGADTDFLDGGDGRDIAINGETVINVPVRKRRNGFYSGWPGDGNTALMRTRAATRLLLPAVQKFANNRNGITIDDIDLDRFFARFRQPLSN